MTEPGSGRRVVLIGAGHAHLEVLRRYGRQSAADMRLTCVAPHAVSTYSGMLPGVLAGQYTSRQMQIDLQRLCELADAELQLGSFRGVDMQERVVLCDDGARVPFDVLSFNVGSTPRLPEQFGRSEAVIPVKPMATFLDRLSSGLARCPRARQHAGPIRISVIGGGVGAVEIALCLPVWIQLRSECAAVQTSLLGGHSRLVPELSSRAEDRLKERLDAAGVRLSLGRPVVRIVDGNPEFADGSIQECDLLIAATTAVGLPEVGELALEQDERGFLLTNRGLQSIACPFVFAAGDCGTQCGTSSPKAGVYAVRQAPVLWHNLQALLSGGRLRPFVPQRNFLKLINTGDGRALGHYRGLTFFGHWVWNLKDRIDRRFVDRFRVSEGRP